MTLTTVSSDESGVQVTGDNGLGVKRFCCPEKLFQPRAPRAPGRKHYHCWRSMMKVSLVCHEKSAQKVLSGMKVVTPRLILHHASIGSRCLPRLVTAWACWLQVILGVRGCVTSPTSPLWAEWLQVVGIGVVVPEIDIFASSTGDFNIIALDHMKKLEICCH